MTIWVKFQKNWRGCLDNFLRIDTEWPLGAQKPIYRLAQRFFRDNSRTAEGMSTSKTLQERFSCDLSVRSNSKLCLHLKFLRKSTFLLCFLPFCKSSWWFSKKFLATVLAFLQGLYLASSAFKDYTKSLTIVLGLGKNMLQQKSKLGQKKQFEKSDFLGFTPKSLPILDFGVQHWNNAKIQPITKSQNFSKCFIALFVTFL